MPFKSLGNGLEIGEMRIVNTNCQVVKLWIKLI